MSEQRLTLRITKPTDCAFAFGIPITEAAFLKARRSPRADYVRQWRGGWPEYDQCFAADARRFAKSLEVWRVETVHDATLSQFGRLLSAGHTVVTLFSHWTEDAIEFGEGLVDIPSIVNIVPKDFSGFLDLCTCHPTALVDALKEHRPLCFVKSVRGKSRPTRWLQFYRVLYHELARHDTTFLRAFETVVTAFDIAESSAGVSNENVKTQH